MLAAEAPDPLAYAHRCGGIHRDVKPDNILIDADSGSPRLTDFGMRRLLSQIIADNGWPVMGTPAYMSSEQARGCLQLDARSDIYSLGVVASEMLSGQLPFEATVRSRRLRKA